MKELLSIVSSLFHATGNLPVTDKIRRLASLHL